MQALERLRGRPPKPLTTMTDFINRVTSAASLRDGLDQSAQRIRQIASRVATASITPDGGFAMPGMPSVPGSPENGAVDLEAEMTSLADEEMRAEAQAKLLQHSYATLRASLKT